jgi:hypothetical protein
VPGSIKGHLRAGARGCTNCACHAGSWQLKRRVVSCRGGDAVKNASSDRFRKSRMGRSMALALCIGSLLLSQAGAATVGKRLRLVRSRRQPTLCQPASGCQLPDFHSRGEQCPGEVARSHEEASWREQSARPAALDAVNRAFRPRAQGEAGTGCGRGRRRIRVQCQRRLAEGGTGRHAADAGDRRTLRGHQPGAMILHRISTPVCATFKDLLRQHGGIRVTSPGSGGLQRRPGSGGQARQPNSALSRNHALCTGGTVRSSTGGHAVMLEAALRLVASGQTTVEELRRVTLSG